MDSSFSRPDPHHMRAYPSCSLYMYSPFPLHVGFHVQIVTMDEGIIRFKSPKRISALLIPPPLPSVRSSSHKARNYIFAFSSLSLSGTLVAYNHVNCSDAMYSGARDPYNSSLMNTTMRRQTPSSGHRTAKGATGHSPARCSGWEERTRCTFHARRQYYLDNHDRVPWVPSWQLEFATQHDNVIHCVQLWPYSAEQLVQKSQRR